MSVHSLFRWLKQAFSGGEGDPVEDLAVKVQSISTQAKQETKKTVKPKEEEEIPKFKKTNILKKGDKVNYPQVGDKVKCYYVGKLSDGTVFNSLLPGKYKVLYYIDCKVHQLN